MTSKTHLAAGVALGLGLCAATQATPDVTVPVICASTLGSLLPDIDTASSKLGRKIAPLAWILRIVFGHRRVFHSLLFWSFAAISLWLLGASPSWAAGLAVGAGSHLVLDMLNPSGIELLWPAPHRIALAKFRCGGIVDHLIGLACTATAIWLFCL